MSTAYEIWQDDTFALVVEAATADEALDRALADATWSDHPDGQYRVWARSAADPSDTAEKVVVVLGGERHAEPKVRGEEKARRRARPELGRRGPEPALLARRGMGRQVNMADIHYHWGQNIPGYLPMADKPNIVTTFDEAKRGLIDDIKDHEDHAAMAEDGEGLAEELCAAAEDVNLWSGPDYICVEDPAREHDLGTAYWIEECAEEECARYDDERS